MAIGDKKSAVMQSDIVNDFTTGGAKNVLSAEMGKTLAQRPNPNLLDNWYFADPIDQRGGWVVPSGTTYYTGWNTGAPVVAGTTTTYHKVLTNDGAWTTISIDDVIYGVPASVVVRGYTGIGTYSIDRWYRGYTNHAALIIHDGYVEMNGDENAEFIQRIQHLLLGETVTASVLLEDNQLAWVTGKLPSTYNGEYFHTGIAVGVPNSNGIHLELSYYNGLLRYNFVCPVGSKAKIVATKLELGTQQTLAHQDADGNWVLNEIPNRAEQLLRCSQSTADASDTYANTSFAPAGYGWGEQSKYYVFLDDADGSKFENAIAPFIMGMKNSTQYAIAFQSHPFLDSVSCQGVIVRTGTRVEIKGVNYYGEGIQRIWDDNTGWFPWEWVNPPMRPGVEYRTTERYMGKPVYAKTVDMGAMPNAAIKEVAHGISSVRYVIDLRIFARDEMNNYLYVPSTSGSDTTLTAASGVGGGSNTVWVNTNADRSEMSGYAYLKYTKTTD